MQICVLDQPAVLKVDQQTSISTSMVALACRTAQIDDPQPFDDPQLFDDQLEVWTLIIQKSTEIPPSLMVLF